MSLELARLKNQIAATPLQSPVPLELAVAIVADCFRLAGVAPPADASWERWRSSASPLWAEQLGMLAHILSATDLRQESLGALARASRCAQRLEAFFSAIQPLTAEMIRANAFRQEEFLRRWASCWDIDIQGESPAQSQARLEQLDYRKALAEFQRAEKARKAEAAERERILEEARQREAAARAWRE